MSDTDRANARAALQRIAGRWQKRGVNAEAALLLAEDRNPELAAAAGVTSFVQGPPIIHGQPGNAAAAPVALAEYAHERLTQLAEERRRAAPELTREAAYAAVFAEHTDLAGMATSPAGKRGALEMAERQARPSPKGAELTFAESGTPAAGAYNQLVKLGEEIRGDARARVDEGAGFRRGLRRSAGSGGDGRRSRRDGGPSAHDLRRKERLMALCNHVSIAPGYGGPGWNVRWWNTPAEAPPGRYWHPCEHVAGHPGPHYTGHQFGDLSPASLALYAERDAARAGAK